MDCRKNGYMIINQKIKPHMRLGKPFIIIILLIYPKTQ